MFISLRNRQGNHRIGDYQLVSRIGEGRYATCYLATTIENEKVVIKRFKPRIFNKNKQKNAYEAVILSQVNHPSVPKLLGVVHDHRFYGFVLELMPGTTVEALLFKDKHAFTDSEIFHIGSQLIDIIAYLHGKGIVHRDLRIPNVLVNNNKVSLVDFGLSRWVDHSRYNYAQDFSYLGDFLLYLHYSSYKKPKGKSKPWYKELELSNKQVHFYKRLLRLEEPYQTIQEVKSDFHSAFSMFHSKRK